MPLDSSIPLQVRPAQVMDPVQAVSQVLTLRDMGMRQQANEAELRRQAIQLKQAEQAEADDAIARDVFRTAGPNLESVAEALQSRGLYTHAAKVRSTAIEQRKATAAALGESFKTTESALKLTSNLLRGATDEPSYRAAIPKIVAAVGPDIARQYLPVTFDKAAIDAVIDQGMDSAERIARLREAANLAEKGPKTAQEWMAFASTALSTAKTKEDWGQTRVSLDTQFHTPPGILAMFPEQFTPDAPAKAALMGISPEKRADLANKDEDQAIERRKLALEQQKVQREIDADVRLSDDAIDIAARAYLKTGQLPSLGMGKFAGENKIRIMDRAALWSPGADLAANAASFAADKGSLAKMQQMRDAVGAFEKTAGKNLQLFVDQAQKIVDTGSPWINTPLRLVSKSGMGSPDLLAYNAARQVAINEIAKVTSNPTLAGQLSDSARHEVENFIPENATLAQTLAVAQVLKRDMENRIKSLDDGLSAVRERIATPQGRESEPAATNPAAQPNTQRPTPSGRTIPEPLSSHGRPSAVYGGPSTPGPSPSTAPSAAQRAEFTQGPGTYELDDGTVWTVDAKGNAQRSGGPAPAKASSTGTTGQSTRTVTRSQVEAVARRNGTSFETEAARATAEGFVIR